MSKLDRDKPYDGRIEIETRNSRYTLLPLKASDPLEVVS